MKWKLLCGVLCDRESLQKLGKKVFKVAFRPAMTYSAETWANEKTQEIKMNVAEMKMLRFACGQTRMDKIENKDIRNKKSQKCTGRSRRKDLDGMGIYKEEKNILQRES
jgi:hypothetical protein